ncbi:MAG: carbon-nitrogen hydrolase family protein [Pseudomonadota bacterium]
MRVAVVQMRSGIDRSENLETATALIREAAASGAQLIVTPEMTTLLDRNRTRLLNSLGEPEPREVDHFALLSQDLGATLVIGSMPVLAPSGTKVANRCFVFGEGQQVATYDKVHLFDVDLETGESWRESTLFEEGGEAVVAQVPGAKLGLSICYDVRFPHLYRALAQAGAQILTIPAAFTVPTGKAHWETLVRARAIENGCFVLAPAQGGTHADGRVTYGHALIVSPRGEVLDTLAHDEPGVAVVDIDLRQVAEMRQSIPSLALDRSPELRIYGA